MPTSELETFIQNKSVQLEEIEKANREAWWGLNTTGEEKYAEQLVSTKLAQHDLFSSKEEFNALSEMTTSDLLLQRQKQLLLFQYMENQADSQTMEEIAQLEARIEELYTNFRPTVDGKAISVNEVKDILSLSKDLLQREKAWTASKMIGEEVEAHVKHLIQLRNNLAINAGFSDYYSMQLSLQELDQVQLFDLANEIEQLTNPLWEKYKSHLDQTLANRFGISIEQLMPWHYHDPFFQEAPAQEIDLNSYYKKVNPVDVAYSVFNTMELPIDDIMAHSDLYERDKKSQHAFCICMDRKQDVRVLCNLRNDEYWVSVLLHELGHAVYDKNIDQNLPFLLRTYAHISTTEASAMLLGRLSKEKDFIKRYCNIDAQSIDEGIVREQAAKLLVFTRWSLVMMHFERAMYQHPDMNYNEYWWQCVNRFQNVNTPPNRSKPDWASKLHLACAPAYYQNYLLGEMTASQWKQSFKHTESAEAGRFLKEKIYKEGAIYPWDVLVERATGERLNPKYFVEDLKR